MGVICQIGSGLQATKLNKNETKTTKTFAIN